VIAIDRINFNAWRECARVRVTGSYERKCITGSIGDINSVTISVSLNEIAYSFEHAVRLVI